MMRMRGYIQLFALCLLSAAAVFIVSVSGYALWLEPLKPVITAGGPMIASPDATPPGGDIFVERTYHKHRACPGDITVTIDCPDAKYRRLLHQGNEQLDVGFTNRKYRNKIPDDAPVGHQCAINVSFTHRCLVVPIRAAMPPTFFEVIQE